MHLARSRGTDVAEVVLVVITHSPGVGELREFDIKHRVLYRAKPGDVLAERVWVEHRIPSLPRSNGTRQGSGPSNLMASRPAQENQFTGRRLLAPTKWMAA